MRGYEVLLPLYRQVRRWSDRTKRVERALFEGYVFCRCTASIVARIISTPGVICVVGDGTRPLPVEPDEIQTIARIVETGVLAEPWPYVEVGERVRIDAGPLMGTEGIVLTVKDQRRLIVSISLLHRSVAVQLCTDWITPVRDSLVEDWRNLSRVRVGDPAWKTRNVEGLV